MTNVIEIFEDELAEAANGLIIEEGDDDQEKLREMILRLQMQAYERGLLSSRTVDQAIAAECSLDSEEAAAMMSSLLRDGRAIISLVVR